MPPDMLIIWQFSLSFSTGLQNDHCYLDGSLCIVHIGLFKKSSPKQKDIWKEVSRFPQLFDSPHFHLSPAVSTRASMAASSHSIALAETSSSQIESNCPIPVGEWSATCVNSTNLQEFLLKTSNFFSSSASLSPSFTVINISIYTDNGNQVLWIGNSGRTNSQHTTCLQIADSISWPWSVRKGEEKGHFIPME